MAYIDDIITAADNLAEARVASDIRSELRLIHIRELSTAVAGFCELSLQHVPDTLSSQDSPAGAAYAGLSVPERAAFCSGLSSALNKVNIGRMSLPDGIVETAESVTVEAAGRISYLRNNYADSAYLAFSPLIRNPRAVYSDGFTGACEDVYNGICEFCILPIENSTDGKLVGFCSLIEKYELKIAAVCDIGYQDNTKNTRFALISKRLCTLFASKSERFFLELAVTPQNMSEISVLLGIAGNCGLELYRIDSLPLSYSDSRFCVHPIFAVNCDGQLRNASAALSAFLTCMYIEIPQSVITGIYPVV